MEKIERRDECFVCDSKDVHWECVESGDVYCEDCANDNEYTCKMCGELLVLF